MERVDGLQQEGIRPRFEGFVPRVERRNGDNGNRPELARKLQSLRPAPPEMRRSITARFGDSSSSSARVDSASGVTRVR